MTWRSRYAKATNDAFPAGVKNSYFYRRAAAANGPWHDHRIISCRTLQAPPNLLKPLCSEGVRKIPWKLFPPEIVKTSHGRN